ncbi:hypothetical protein [Catellatospora vulcania]|uniref:hypothetical protein n=1 Tax=Catellatospora vulcania TaxID=1460450 RepID=UPI0012D44B46|nr:hypothetical protein [Catellatospora vulcania]
MRILWRAAVGGLAGLVGAVTWAISSAVYQPLMEPSGVWFDDPGGWQAEVDGVVQQTASNNTYWPRELRQLAVLLAVAGILVLCRTASRAVATAAVAAGGWLIADVLLDRFDVHGTSTAVVLAAAATGYVAATAFIAIRLSRADSGGPAVRHVVAGTLALLAVISLLVITPWDEPVTPALIRVEAEMTALKIVVSVLFAVLAATTVGRPPARAGVTLGFCLVAVAGAVFMVVGDYRSVYEYGLPVAAVAALVAVPAPRIRSVAGLVGMTLLSAVCAVASFAVLVIGGMVVGSLLTRLADNPPVNGADTDISTPLLVTLLGIAVSLLTLAVTALPAALRAVRAGPPGSPAAAG